jgi:hypothetical protein
MIISMQGNWTVAVKSKNASFPQRFVVQGALFGNGVHNGTPGNSVFVFGKQWSIAIQHDPGTGWQSSDSKITFPHKISGNYEFDIQSNDSGGSDQDFNDLILTCSTPETINDFIIYGNVTLYSGRCYFNPCRRFPFVIDTYPGLLSVLKNPVIKDWLEKYYPERIPPIITDPNPPDPTYFKPIVFDLNNEAIQPKTTLRYSRKAIATASSKKGEKKTAEEEDDARFAVSNYELIRTAKPKAAAVSLASDRITLAKQIEGLLFPCFTDPGSRLTLTFEEYDRTAAELAGGGYTGEGNRRLLGDTVTDMHGNYIFRFRFDMTFPGLEDNEDQAPGEASDTVMYPDVIVKIVDYAPFEVKYESAPYYNIPNLKRINICLPESRVRPTSSCFNGNLIGSLGNVFIGGNQNTAGSFADSATQRYEYSNYLESSGKITVRNAMAGFQATCAAWNGTIDMKGCMYDAKKSASENKIKWYTIRVIREGTSGWTYVSQNYKHPKFSKRNLPNYHGDDVGPFYPNVGGALNGLTPAYINIQREIFVDSIDWEFSNLDRYMQLNTAIYDVIAGIRTPGKFFVRVDGYDVGGNHVPNATDLIPLFIHNNGLGFQMTGPILDDGAIAMAECGLYRLTDAQMATPMKFKFRVKDDYGFVNDYQLSMGRCPNTSNNLHANIQGNFAITGGHIFPGGSTFPSGDQPLNVHHTCPGYRGTLDDYATSGLIDVVIQPQSGESWIKTGEYFNIYSFGLTASQRITNGYNSGTSGLYQTSSQLLMERLNP